MNMDAAPKWLLRFWFDETAEYLVSGARVCVSLSIRHVLKISRLARKLGNDIAVVVIINAQSGYVKWNDSVHVAYCALPAVLMNWTIPTPSVISNPNSAELNVSWPSVV